MHTDIYTYVYMYIQPLFLRSILTIYCKIFPLQLCKHKILDTDCKCVRRHVILQNSPGGSQKAKRPLPGYQYRIMHMGEGNVVGTERTKKRLVHFCY